MNVHSILSAKISYSKVQSNAYRTRYNTRSALINEQSQRDGIKHVDANLFKAVNTRVLAMYVNTLSTHAKLRSMKILPT